MPIQIRAQRDHMGQYLRRQGGGHACQSRDYSCCAAVLKALFSDFHGMTRNKLVGAIGVDLGVASVVIDGTKDLATEL